MRAVVIAVLTCCLASPAAAQKCPEVVPGVSIDKVAVGQARAGLKLPPNVEVFAGEDRAKVSRVGLDLLKARCFRLDGKTIKVTGRPESLAVQLGCGPVEHAIGASNIYCRGGKLGLVWNERGGMGYLSLRVVGPDRASKQLAQRSSPVCDVYLLAGRSIITAKKELAGTARRPASLAIEKGKRYCFDNRVVTSEWVEKNIWDIPARSCGEKMQGKQKVVSCDYWGIRFYFAHRLQRVEVYPAKR